MEDFYTYRALRSACKYLRLPTGPINLTLGAEVRVRCGGLAFTVIASLWEKQPSRPPGISGVAPYIYYPSTEQEIQNRPSFLSSLTPAGPRGHVSALLQAQFTLEDTKNGMGHHSNCTLCSRNVFQCGCQNRRLSSTVLPHSPAIPHWDLAEFQLSAAVFSIKTPRAEVTWFFSQSLFS